MIAMTCKEAPDTGAAAGIESHNYDGVSKRYKTSYTFKCPFGKNHMRLFNKIYLTIPRKGFWQWISTRGKQHLWLPRFCKVDGLLEIQLN